MTKSNLLKTELLVVGLRSGLWVAGDTVAGQTQAPGPYWAQKGGFQTQSETLKERSRGIRMNFTKLLIGKTRRADGRNKKISGRFRDDL